MIIFNHVQNNEQIFSSYIYLHALKKLGLDIVFCQKNESFITLMWMIKYFNYLDVNLPTRSPQYQTDEIFLSPQKRYLKSYLYIYFSRNWKTCPYLTTICFCFVYFNQHQNTTPKYNIYYLHFSDHVQRYKFCCAGLPFRIWQFYAFPLLKNIVKCQWQTTPAHSSCSSHVTHSVQSMVAF